MNIIKTLVAALVAIPLAWSAQTAQKDAQTETKESAERVSAIKLDLTEEKVKEHVSKWSEPSQKAADFMLKKYGLPSGVSDSMLVWEDSKPFKRSVVHKEAIDHNFPMPHKDVLEQTIDYKSPTKDEVRELHAYDGSVFVKRTPGELSAMCDAEAANFLALNLAHEIINDERTVDEARLEYGQQILLLKNGKPTEYVQKLTFEQPEKAGDPDQSIMDRIDRQKVLAE